MNINPNDYPNLRINGPITAKLAITPSASYDSVLLIVGPTGAGKSTFIETLAQDPSLRISSNQLEGFTQTINTYRVINVECDGQQIFCVDVPGFADTRISMMNIVSMLKKWVQESRAMNLGRILYFTPIHSVRLPGSHREVLRAFEALTGAGTARNITIVTTMWDNIWGEGATKRAESNFNQLQNTVWKEYIDKGGQIVKFHNTQQSAVSIVNTAFRELDLHQFVLENELDGKKQLKSTPFANHLMDNLKGRIQNLEIELATTKMDLQGASERGDDLLKSTLIPNLKETETLLAKFKLYDNFGIVSPSLPDIPSAIDGPSNVDTPVATSPPAEGDAHHAAPSSSTLSPAAELETTLQPPVPTQTPGSPSNQTGALVSAIANPILPKQRLIACVIRLVKCWGDAVADHHDA